MGFNSGFKGLNENAADCLRFLWAYYIRTGSENA